MVGTAASKFLINIVKSIAFYIAILYRGSKVK